jgi:hypothetical protein
VVPFVFCHPAVPELIVTILNDVNERSLISGKAEKADDKTGEKRGTELFSCSHRVVELGSRSREVKNFAEFGGDGAVVGMGGHDFAHMGPPALADFGAGDGFPLGGAGEFDVGEELTGFGMEEDGVGADAVVEQGAFEFRPDGTMATFVFGFDPGIHRHDEGFADGHERNCDGKRGGMLLRD